MLNIVKQTKNPELLVVTPLLTGHKISSDTKIGITRNDINFTWVSYTSDGNTAHNFAEGIRTYRNKFYMPNYVIMIDKDIIPSRHMLDRMYTTLKNSSKEIAFCYCNFEFSGAVNKKFYNIEYDPIRLLHANYISSNSMIKVTVLDEVGGVITDNKYKRLLDWCLWLQLLSYGYYGILCRDASFVAVSDKQSISTGTEEDYKRKYELVKSDFVLPLLDGVIY